MESISPILHPNPGWSHTELSEQSQYKQMAGKHCILELYECDEIKLNDEAFVRIMISRAAKISGATLLNLITHKFTPHGVTALALLAESHISIHTWPESRYAAIDVFTCGFKTFPEKACNFLQKEFGAQTASLQSLKRKTPSEITNSYRKIN